MKSNKPVKCKICDKKYVNKSALIAHIEKTHFASIPEGWDAARYENYLRTGKTEGHCVYCKTITGWNDATGKYNRMCGSEACKKTARELANKNYIGIHGKPYSINNPEQQRKLIYGRKTSGTYVFEDEDTGKKYKAMYDSSYGKDFFEMLDTFLNWDGSDIIAPSPHTYWYEYEGKKHFYIPDAYSTSLNLEIELKDGGDNPNMHPKIQAVDKVKEQKKDAVMKSLEKEVNYIKICNKDYSEFFAMLSELKSKDECKLPKWESRLESVTESLVLEPLEESYSTNNPKIQTILDMNKRLNQFEYGIPVNGNIKTIPGGTEYAKYYKYLPPKDFEKYNGGVCWDYVEYQRHYLDKKGIKVTTYFIDDTKIDQTHTISIIRIGNEYFYSESSFKDIRGVYKSSNINDILKFVVEKMEIENYRIHSYDACRKYGIGCMEFISWVYDNGSYISEGSSKDFCKNYKVPEKISEDDVLPENTAVSLESLSRGINSYEDISESTKDPYKDLLLLDKDFYKRQVKLNQPVINYDDLVDYYRKKLFHSNLNKKEWMNLYNEIVNAREYLKKISNKHSNNYDERMEFEAKKALSQIESMIQYMEESSVSESVECEPEKGGPGHILTVDFLRNRYNYDMDITESVSNKIPKMYFVSGISMDDELLFPRIPKNFLTENNYDDNTTPRVCFSPSIDKCLIALSQNLKGKELYVHIPEDGEVNSKYIYHPTKEEVPDCKITGEIWYKQKINIRVLGKIKVIEATDDEYTYSYGGDKEATLYGWKWEWVWKSEEANESILLEAKDINLGNGYYKYTTPNKDGVNRTGIYKLVNGKRVGEIKYWEPYGEVYDLEVDSKYRGKGYGSELLDLSIREYDPTRIAVAKDNKQAYDMYVKRDFKRFKSFVNPADNKDTWYMKRTPSKPVCITEETILEACKDVATARRFCEDVKKLGKKYNANFYLVTDGASVTSNDGNPAVKVARDAVANWERNNGFDDKEDWSNNPKDFTNYYLKESSIVDFSGIMEDILLESSNQDKVPVYLVITSYKSVVASMIKVRTGSMYNHAAIALTPDLKECYSFVREITEDDIGGKKHNKNGFYPETLDSYIAKDATMKINAVYVTRATYDKLVQCIDMYKKSNTSYNYFNLIYSLFNIPKDVEFNKMNCSVFVDYVLKSSNLDITHKPSNLVTPDDLATSDATNKSIITVYSGKAKDYDSRKIKKISFESSYIEAIKEEVKYYPVFIFLSYTGTNMAKLIKSFTKDPYAHSSISFDTDLNHMISFNRDGMVIEDIKKSVYAKNKDNVRYSLYMYMATGEEYEAMRNFVNELLSKQHKLKYNVLGLTNFVFGRGSSNEDKFFCSEFVASVINAGNQKLIKTQPYMTTPYMLAKNKNFIFIKTGILSHYDSKVIDKLVEEKIEERGWSDVIIK